MSDNNKPPMSDEQALITLAILDAMNDWVNNNDRETIPRNAFLDIAKTAASEIVKQQTN